MLIQERKERKIEINRVENECPGRFDGREQPLLSFKGLVSDWPRAYHFLNIANMPTASKC